MMSLDVFLTSKNRNAWIKCESADVYLRKSSRLLSNDKRENCIDIATISCKKQRKGTFTRLVKALQDKTKLSLFLENTHREFAEACRRHGWLDCHKMSDERLGIFCLYLPKVTEREEQVL